jgi:hypothetical protein
VTGNDTAHYVLGGKVLSDSEVAKIRQEQKELRRTAYETQPFLSRMFDKESEFSPMVKLAMAMPADKSSAISNVTAKFSNPLKLVSGVFGSLFSTSSVGAQVETKVVDDPFGIDQYGFPDFDPSYLEDPEEYWAKCVAERLTNRWNEEGAAGATFENGWQPVNTKPNRCLLIQAAAGASGAMFTEDVLAPDERSGSSGTGGDITTQPPVTPPPETGLLSPPNLGNGSSDGYYRMPSSSLFEWNGGTPVDSRCGSKALVDVIYTVMVRWNAIHPDHKIRLGDLNAPGHLSHRNGVDVDIYSVDGFMANVSGNREASIELGKLFVDTGIVKEIYYNDSAVQQAVNSYAASKGESSNFMYYQPGHEDHFHVRLDDRYRLATRLTCPPGI